MVTPQTQPQTTPAATASEPLWSMAEQVAGQLENLAALLAVFQRSDALEQLNEGETVAVMALAFDLAHEARSGALAIMNADLARVRQQ